MQQHTHTNALISENSPYLLQHAHNPVHWRAWNDETFRLAQEQDKPVFLSIGYSTCHWCHVMERESFEDEGIAALLNGHFIAVKVDREERPDVDAVYMAVCQAVTGSGGWPLSVFMTPDKKPFFVGTYFPKESRQHRPGFRLVLEQIAAKWKNERDAIHHTGEAIVHAMRERQQHEEDTAFSSAVFDEAARKYEQFFDSEHGGFGGRPKFPSPHNLLFLLRYYKRTHNARALQMVEQTLHSMRKGGIFDHIGYGFHRYSTDSEWLLPHFEKMLYDQALMCLAYTEAWQATGKAEYEQTAREVLAYVLRDMTSSEGGFYSAEDADSEGIEGKFYVWKMEDLREALGEEDAALFAKVYRCVDEGNFADEATGYKTGDNIPHLTMPLQEFVALNHMENVHVAEHLEHLRRKLFTARKQRVHPSKDDKVLADWNGLMIAAMARAGRVLREPQYVQAAERAFAFVTTAMRDANGRLLHRWRAGSAAIAAFLDDYAFVIWAALELYEATFKTEFLLWAKNLCDDALRLFGGDEHNGFAFLASDHEELILPVKEGYDGAVPSGNSTMAYVLARLGKLLNSTEYLNRAHTTIQHFGKQIQSYPIGFAQMLIALDLLVHPTQEIVVSGTGGDAAAMLDVLTGAYLPFSVQVHNDGSEALHALVDYAQHQPPIQGKATAYLCENYACREPITDNETLRRELL